MRKHIVAILVIAVFCTVLAGCACEHAWEKADCDTPKTCEKCGETTGSPKGHSWLAANCETAKTCEICGKTKGDPIGHTWLEATCETAKTCDKCGKVEGTPAEHVWLEATCESAAICSSCGDEKDAPIGHQWKEATRDDPKTCTACGKQEGSPLTIADAYPEGESRHDGTSFLMNEEDYITLYNDIFKRETSLKINILSRTYKSDSFDIAYSYLNAPGQELVLEVDQNTKRITRMIIALGDSASYDDGMTKVYLYNCVLAYEAANGNITPDAFVDYINETTYEDGAGSAISTGVLDGVAYRLEVQYHSLTMEIWVDDNGGNDDREEMNGTANLTEEEAAVVGEWTQSYGYNASEGLIMEEEELTRKLYLNDDLTGKIVNNTDVITFTWHYVETWSAEQVSDAQYMTFECVLDSDLAISEDESIHSFEFDIQIMDTKYIFMNIGDWLYQFK